MYDPNTGAAKIFKQSVLPFGSIASVTSFLRVSLAIWKVGASLLKLMWSAYFDDFLCLARQSESRHVDFCVDASRHVDFCVGAVFALLGWRISKHKHKLIDFDSLCQVLGVQLDQRQSGDRLCFVSNTEDRVEELVKDIGEIITSKLLTRAEGERPRGRLQFAGS